jgi:FkbH-like protein
MKVLNNKIKLVIWDLDDTFWTGTISEESILAVEYNANIIKELTNRGIINSISSKNNFEDAKKELEKMQIWDYFVFPQIGWDPKGKIIKDLIENLNLRADNVLFIDDNILNLNEALFFSPNLNVCLPEFIPTLLDSEYLKGKDDSQHSRLAQYKNLENKHVEFSKSKLSNVEFLKESDIKVEIKNDCLNEIDRIYELVERTNQLNYTKNRSSLEELKIQLMDKDSSSGYVKVTDKYGVYGISGFYLIKNEELVHFLFSCRTMNMYIESWVYQQLAEPKLVIVGEVAMPLDLNQDLSFINNTNTKVQNVVDKQIQGDQKILMMGGCDLDQVVYYLDYDQMITEFNYPNSLNINVHKDHTYLIKQFKTISDSHLEVIKDLAVLDVKDVNLKLNSSDWDILIFSPLNDFSRGLYKHKKTGFILPFDSFNIDWTLEENWKNLPKHLVTLPLTFLQLLKSEFEFLGPISPKDFELNIEWLLENYREKKFVFLTGSEVLFESEHYWENNMKVRHVAMNSVLRSFENNINVKIVDVTKFVTDKADLRDNIRHYNKLAYKKISDEIILVTNEWLKNKLTVKSNLHMLYEKIIKKIRKKIQLFFL